MRKIFEKNVEHTDFLELILQPEEIERIAESGVVQDFAEGLEGKRNLNVFIRSEECH
jgi:hypothetical protein